MKMGLFDFLSMPPYEERVVGRYSIPQKGILISTAAVSDSKHPFETYIEHPRYRSGKGIIVQNYLNREDAKQGHGKWVKTMIGAKLPTVLREVGQAELATLLDKISVLDWRKYYIDQPEE